MPHSPALARYVRQVRRRLTLALAARGLGLFAGAAVFLTLGAVLLLRAFGFVAWSILTARSLLAAGLLIVAACVLARPLLRLRHRRWLRHVETRDRELGERLRTVLDRGRDADAPMLELLVGDTLDRAAALPPERLVPPRMIAPWAAAAGALAALLLWMGMRAPGFVGHGTALLWTGWLTRAAAHEVVVEPGSVTLRRRSDLLIRARPMGYYAETATLSVRHAGAAEWEAVPMRPRPDADGFELVVAGVDAALRYRVSAGPATSPEFDVSVEEMPEIRGITLVYRYPEWTKLAARTQQGAGDIRAVAGTSVEVQIETDRPLAAGVLRVDETTSLPLEAGGTRSRGRVDVHRDGRYFVAALYRGELVRLSDDHLIEVVPDEPPVTKLARPGRDVRASAIEEVTVELDAEDDFALRDVELRYSVNGGKESVVPMPAGGGTAKGAHTLALETHGLAPGDLVSYYAVARDAKTESRTDMSFVEVAPFEREFFQSQQSGGGEGGGTGGETGQISRRQKDLVVATWNQARDRRPDAVRTKEDAKALSEIQARLRAQATTLAERMRRRGLAEVDKDFQSFVTHMDDAAAAMEPAVQQLSAARWSDALPAEQRALQHLLRAEAVFRRIEVSRGRQGGGGGGGGESRDLAEMFELELDAEKNQYETRQQAATRGAGEMDDLQRRLQELSRRHEELTRTSPRDLEARLEQRWRQQVLRRELEELARSLERARQREAGRGEQRQGRSAEGAQESAERRAAIDGASRRLQDAARELQEAERAAATEDRRRAEARASGRLREAAEMLGREQQRRADAAPGGRDRAGAERALEALRRARERLEPLRAERPRGGPPQPGEGGSGEPEGEAAGRDREGRADRAAAGGADGAGAADGDRGRSDAARGEGRIRPSRPGEVDQAWRQAIEELSGVQRALSRDSELGAAAERLRQALDSARSGRVSAPGNPALIERELQALMLAAAPLEEALRRRVETATGPPVRTLTRPGLPPEHGDAIADYYRRLSESE